MQENKSKANSLVNLGPNQLLINGNWEQGCGGEVIAVECPANKKIICSVPRGNSEDVDKAVNAAESAFSSWSRMPASDRGRFLLRIADAIESRAEELARLVAHETGNAIRTQSRPEAYGCAAIFRYFGGLSNELKGTTYPAPDDVLSYTRREPLGVVAAIVPWNAPASLASAKIAPALCAGNTVVLKPAEDAPLGVLWLASICSQFLPPGVLNVVTGIGPECGSALVNHPKVRKVSFTGSTAVGKGIIRAAAEGVTPFSLELGGKSPTIVFEDSDNSKVVEGVALAMRFTRQSQSCTAGSRLFLHEKIFDSFLEKLTTYVNSLVIGDPLEELTDTGTIINKKQFNRVCEYIKEGKETPNVDLITGGLPPTTGSLSQGYFLQPTVFSCNSNDWKLAREEIFGPVLMAIPWRDEDDVIRMANDTHFGLAGFVFSKDTGRAIRIAHQLDAGWVQVNQGKGQSIGQPYGGFKQSGIGKEFSLDSMIDSYTRLKSVTVNIGS